MTVEHLEQGGATRCYASDIANRLLGWTQRAESTCPFDSRAIIPSASEYTPLVTSCESSASTAQATSSLTLPVPNSNCSVFHFVKEGDTCNSVA